jgi:hypothetical protein
MSQNTHRCGNEEAITVLYPANVYLLISVVCTQINIRGYMKPNAAVGKTEYKTKNAVAIFRNFNQKISGFEAGRRNSPSGPPPAKETHLRV